jgi:hypothetical protein
MDDVQIHKIANEIVARIQAEGRSNPASVSAWLFSALDDDLQKGLDLTLSLDAYAPVLKNGDKLLADIKSILKTELFSGGGAMNDDVPECEPIDSKLAPEKIVGAIAESMNTSLRKTSCYFRISRNETDKPLLPHPLPRLRLSVNNNWFNQLESEEGEKQAKLLRVVEVLTREPFEFCGFTPKRVR